MDSACNMWGEFCAQGKATRS